MSAFLTHLALTVYIFVVGEVMTSHKSILFRTTSNDIGEKASQIVPERPVLHGCNLKFSAVSYKAQLFDPNLISTASGQIGHVSEQRTQDRERRFQIPRPVQRLGGKSNLKNTVSSFI